jgi:putative FmdB family regulatory protein
MPIYEYQCEACGHRLEALQKLSDAPLKKCPECGEPALHKLVSAAGFRLKGGGWYETDFKSGNKRNVAGEGEKQSSENKDKKDAKDKKAETPKESTVKKTESKTESKPKPAQNPKAD